MFKHFKVPFIAFQAAAFQRFTSCDGSYIRRNVQTETLSEGLLFLKIRGHENRLGGVLGEADVLSYVTHAGLCSGAEAAVM